MDRVMVLKSIGFTETEARIYLSLVENGESSPLLIAERTRLNRTHVYDRLRHLQEKGAVTCAIKAGKQQFLATPPKLLLGRLDERQQAFRDLVSDLETLHKQHSEATVLVYKGREGLKSLLQDVLETRKEIWIFGYTGAVEKEIQFFYPFYQRQRVKKKIRRRILTDATLKSSRALDDPLTKARFLPGGIREPGGMWLYGDKMVLFLPGDILLMIYVQHEAIVKLYRKYFQLLWDFSA